MTQNSALSQVHSAPTLGPSCAHTTHALRPGCAHNARWAPCHGYVVGHSRSCRSAHGGAGASCRWAHPRAGAPCRCAHPRASAPYRCAAAFGPGHNTIFVTQLKSPAKRTMRRVARARCRIAALPHFIETQSCPPQPRYKVLYRNPLLARPCARMSCRTPLRTTSHVVGPCRSPVGSIVAYCCAPMPVVSRYSLLYHDQA